MSESLTWKQQQRKRLPFITQNTSDRYKVAFEKEIEEFAQALLNNTPVSCSGEDGLEAQKLAIAAKKAWVEKRTVEMHEI